MRDARRPGLQKGCAVGQSVSVTAQDTRRRCGGRLWRRAAWWQCPAAPTPRHACGASPMRPFSVVPWRSPTRRCCSFRAHMVSRAMLDAPPCIWTAAACHNCCSARRSMKHGWSFEQCRSSLLRLGVSGACGYLSIPERHSMPDSWRCRGWSGAHAGASIITGRKVFLRRRGLRWTCGTTTGRSRPPPSPGAPTPCTLFASTR